LLDIFIRFLKLFWDLQKAVKIKTIRTRVDYKFILVLFLKKISDKWDHFSGTI